MSEPLNYQYVEDEPQEYEGDVALEQPPVLVKNVTTPGRPEYGGVFTWSIPVVGTGQPIQILQRRIRRFKAKVEINFTVAGSVTFNSNLDHLTTGQGYVVTVPVAGLYRFHDWENQQPLYVIASVSGLVAMVLDESYAGR